jgi:hypothetical protein
MRAQGDSHTEFFNQIPKAKTMTLARPPAAAGQTSAEWTEGRGRRATVRQG